MFDATQKPQLFSGGGGGVSTASDYLLFCQMLLNGGELGKTRLLSPSTIHLMTSNALKPGIEYAPAVTRVFNDLGPSPGGFLLAVDIEPDWQSISLYVALPQQLS
jgi:CubicO group peptidase (beta-lactamase class C family)